MPGFTEVPAPHQANALGAWGGWWGEGSGGSVDAEHNVLTLGSLFIGTGSRGPAGGGSSRIFRLDRPDGTWEDDGAPGGSETIRKIRSGIDPATRADRLFAFFETPGGGQTWLISRANVPGPSAWSFESVPTEGADVGGEGLGVPLRDLTPEVEPRLFAGASQNWNQPELRSGKVFQKMPDASWNTIRAIGPQYGHHPTLMWCIEFDGLGRYWEHFNDFGAGSAAESGTFINNQAGTPPAPGGDISSMAWFDGWMYTCGALEADPNNRSGIFRIQNGWGTNWEGIHRLQVGVMSDHLLRVPRGEPPGELWVVGHAPLEAAYTLDGSTWTRDLTIPPISTGDDTNAVTAIAYWDGSVWIVSRDSRQGTLRAWRDKPEKGATPALSGQIV
jgi:hypothetical protein